LYSRSDYNSKEDSGNGKWSLLNSLAEVPYES
jgi:hypothetical protein